MATRKRQPSQVVTAGSIVLGDDTRPLTPEELAANGFGPGPAAADPEGLTPLPESPGVVRSFGDLVTRAGAGAVGAAKSVTDAFGADNAASRVLDSTQKGIQNLESDYGQTLRKRTSERMERAAASGSAAEEFRAALASFAEAPGRMLAEGAGSLAIPGGAGLAARFARLGPAGIRVAMGLAGAGQGAGAVKGSIFETTKSELIKAGTPEAETDALARDAQSYLGPNADQIGIGTALGAAASTTGAERVFGKLISRGTAERVVADKHGLLRTVGTTMATEGATEGLQGGQEQLAGNIAAQREGLDVPTWRGVAGQASLEGTIGGVLGGAAGGVDVATRGASEGQALPTVEEMAGGAVPADVQQQPEPPVPPAAAAPAEPAEGPLTRAARQAAAAMVARTQMGEPPAMAGAASADPAARPSPGERMVAAVRRARGELGEPDGERDPVQPADWEIAPEPAPAGAAPRIEARRALGYTMPEPEIVVDPEGNAVPLTPEELSRQPERRFQAAERREMLGGPVTRVPTGDDIPEVSQADIDASVAEGRQAPAPARAASEPDLPSGRSSGQGAGPTPGIAPAATPAPEPTGRGAAAQDSLAAAARPAPPAPSGSGRGAAPAGLPPINRPRAQRPEFDTPAAAWGHISTMRRVSQTRLATKVVPTPGGKFIVLTDVDPGFKAARSVPRPEAAAAAPAAPAAAAATITSSSQGAIGRGAGQEGALGSTGADRPGLQPGRGPGRPGDGAPAPGVARAAGPSPEAGGRGATEARAAAPEVAAAPAPAGRRQDRRGRERAEAIAARQAAATPAPSPRPAEDADRPAVDAAASETAGSPENDRPAPTEAQREAENFAAGHTRLAGQRVTVQYQAGTRRKPEWKPLNAHYGHFIGIKSIDGENLDVFVNPGTPDDWTGPVFVVDQLRADGTPDEHKVLWGYPDEASARATYLGNYPRGFRGLGAITEMSQDEFRAWLQSADTDRPASADLQEDPPEVQFQRRVGDEPAGSFTRIAVPNSTVRWMGLSGPRAVRADLEALARRHSEHYADPDAVRADIEFVLARPDGWYIHKASRVVLFRERIGSGTIPQARVEVEASADSMLVRSVYIGGKRQIAKKMANKRQLLGGLDLVGQSLDALSIADYLKALGSGSSRPTPPSGGAIEANSSLPDRPSAVDTRADGRGLLARMRATEDPSPDDKIPASPRQIREIERRYGQAVRDLFDVEPAGLTAAEAGYVLGFRDADALRDRGSAAVRENDRRKGERGLQGSGPARQQVGDGPPGDPQLRRAAGAAALSLSDVRAEADRVLESWTNAPPVTVLDTFDDAPAAVRKHADALDAADPPVAFVHDGRIYLVADRMRGTADVQSAVLHEAVGHLGLRGAFGDELGAVLDDLARRRPREIAQKLRQYGLTDTAANRRVAAEELVASLAETDPKLPFVRRVIAAIRGFLRRAGLLDAISDADIIRELIEPARAWAQAGGKPAGRTDGAAVAYQRRGEQKKPIDPVPAGGMTGAERQATANRAVQWLMGNWRDARANGRTFARWRGINTQYHKATLDRDFRRVFDRAQAYSNDTSLYANDAADLAPRLLPNLANFGDIWHKARQDPKSVDKVSEALLTGTLLDTDPAKGRVWSDAELASRFGLNEAEIGLYREARAAVDRSLDDLGRSEILRFADRFLADGAKREIMGSSSLDQGLEIALEHLQDEADYAAQGQATDRREEIVELMAALRDKARRVAELKSAGYFPLMRFGRYGVWISRPDPGKKGEKETLYFSVHESLREANRHAREMLAQLKRDYPNASVRQGIMAQEEGKLLAGVTPDTLEVFGRGASLEGDPAWEAYIRLVKNNRSAMKRLLERKGTPGYSRDLTRTLAAFITSNARAISANIHARELKQAVADIPKHKGDVADEASRMVRYLEDPTEEAQALRGVMFNWFIGGSVASAAVNLTQPLTMTYPWLAVKDGAVKAAGRVTKAMKDVLGGNLEPELREAMRQSEREGIVEPQQIHALQGEVSRSLGTDLRLRKFLHGWGYLFQAAERFNRRVTFVAAWRQARDTGAADPAAEATRAVIETQGVYNKGNRPNWARGAVGATVFTFKQFSIGYVEFLARLLRDPKSRPAGLLALGVMVALAGVSGLPFAEDAEDLIDTLGQAAGYNLQSSEARRQFLASVIGNEGANFLDRGVSALPGVPIDVQGRLGLGNLLPGTGAFLKSTRDASAELAEVGGAAGGLYEAVVKGIGGALAGDTRQAAMAIVPVAVRNAAMAADMFSSGQYRDTRGRNVVEADATEAAAKAIGFQPRRVSDVQRAMRDVQVSVAVVRRVESEIAGQWARALVDDDQRGQASARARLADWNRKNPETPIRITPAQLRSRAQQIRSSKAERLIKATPRELRAVARERMAVE